MRKIINGKNYDTETAEEIGAIQANCSYSEFCYWEERLFKKRTGEFFLYGEGGASSMYRSVQGDGFGYGSHIMPLTYKQAREWAEKNLSTKDYEKNFGEVSENDELAMVTISITISQKEKLKRKASMEGISVSEYIGRIADK